MRKKYHDFYHWTEDAKCSSLHPDAFDLQGDNCTLESKRITARKMCEGCPVIAKCAQDVLENDSYGLVRAGLWTPGWMCGGPLNRSRKGGALVKELQFIAATGRLPEPEVAASRQTWP